MTRARESIIDLEATPYYHCISRCVRRAFLGGECEFSGQNFEHRRSWITDRMSELAAAFAIEVASYAVMSSTAAVTHFLERIERKIVNRLTLYQRIFT